MHLILFTLLSLAPTAAGSKIIIETPVLAAPYTLPVDRPHGYAAENKGII